MLLFLRGWIGVKREARVPHFTWDLEPRMVPGRFEPR